MKQLKPITILTLILILISPPAFGQTGGTPDKEGVLWRTLLAIGGGAGGMMLSYGLLDDDRHTTNTFLTTMAVATAGGAIGGFFLGRHLDKRSFQRSQDELGHALLRHQWRQGQVEGITPIRFSTAGVTASSR